jgi:hypothetical protein
VWSWNESWYFSWIDLDGGPAGFFRLGLLPNQQRALIWNYVFHDGVRFGTEETRLRYDDFDLADGMAYDRFGLRFAWRVRDQTGDQAGGQTGDAARFAYDGIVREVTGAGAGGFVPLALDLTAAPTTEPYGTGTGNDLGSEHYPASRFEQSMAVTGTVRVGDETRSVRAGGHRDRSWGPRIWRVTFTLGDLQSEGAQLYFVGAPQLGERGGGYLRDASGVRTLRCIEGAVEYDDDARTIAPVHLRFAAADGEELDVELVPVSPSVSFDMAHTCEVPEHWLYWRILVDARVTGWAGPARGWVEANRYGIA